jgi:hypothetical protein
MIAAGGITIDKRTLWLATEHTGVPAWSLVEENGTETAHSREKREAWCDVLKQGRAIPLL